MRIAPFEIPRALPLEKGAPTGKTREEKLRQACSEFEALFLQQMWRAMRRTVSPAGLFGGERQEETIHSLFEGELSRSLARRGGIGLGQMLYRSMAREPKVHPGPQAAKE